jgi:RNase P/RNase MRP subunit POP5
MRHNIHDKNSWERIKPWLTIFEENKGILRCAHTSKQEAVELLTSIRRVGKENMPVRIETLGTSGTIKKAKKKFLGNLY